MQSNRSPAAKQYDLWSTVYDRIWGRYARKTAVALVERAEIDASNEVLDVGCGTGVLAGILLERVHPRRFVGVDNSGGMLEKARSKFSRERDVRFLRGDAHRLPFDSESFDVVLSSSTLHYFNAPGEALSEMKRVVRPNGRLYLLDWSREFLVMRLRNAVLRVVDPAHAHTYSADEIAELFGRAGLEIRRFETLRIGTYGFFFASAVPRL